MTLCSGEEEPPEEDDTAHEADFHYFRTWVDHITGDGPAREMALRAAVWSLGVFLLGFVLAALGGAGVAYLQAPSAYLIGVGILLTTLSYMWASHQFLSLWSRIRDAFATEEEMYNSMVRTGLRQIYNDRAIFTEFLAVTIGILSLQFLVPIPAAIPIEGAFQVEFSGLRVQYGDIVNHAIGIVVLLYVVTGIHMATTAFALLYRVTHLPLVEPRTAASELDAFADFSAVSATMWFLVVILILFVYQPFFTYVFDLGGAFGISFWVLGTVVTILLVGVAIFLIPQVAIHTALVERKRERLRELDQELEDLLDSLRDDDRSSEEISLALELHDRRRERVQNARTWLYDLRRLFQLAGSGIAAALTLLREVASVSNSLGW